MKSIKHDPIWSEIIYPIFWISYKDQIFWIYQIVYLPNRGQQFLNINHNHPILGDVLSYNEVNTTSYNDVAFSTNSTSIDKQFNSTTIEIPTHRDTGIISFFEKVFGLIRQALFDNGIVQISIFVAGLLLFIIVLGFNNFK